MHKDFENITTFVQQLHWQETQTVFPLPPSFPHYPNDQFLNLLWMEENMHQLLDGLSVYPVVIPLFAVFHNYQLLSIWFRIGSSTIPLLMDEFLGAYTNWPIEASWG